MFAKLLKHEWRASFRALAPLSLAALGAGLLGGILIKLTDRVGEYEETADALLVGLSLLLVAVVLVLVAYGVAVQIILVVNFYRSRFTDRGYLTFTLPVKTRHIFLSSAVNMMIWTAISAVVIIAAVGILAAFGIATVGDLDLEDVFGRVYNSVQEAYSDLYDTRGYVITSVLSAAVSFVFAPFMAITCVTIGAVAAKKHKILAAFATYYIISVIVSIVQSVAQASMLIASAAADRALNMAQSMLPQMFTQLVFIVLGYLISVHLMKKKLNLP